MSDNKITHVLPKIFLTYFKSLSKNALESALNVFGKEAYQQKALEIARCARYILEMQGVPINGISGFIFNIGRRMRGISKCCREFIRDDIAIEYNVDGTYVVYVDLKGPVLQFLKKGMNILSYIPGYWEEKIKVWA